MSSEVDGHNIRGHHTHVHYFPNGALQLSWVLQGFFLFIFYVPISCDSLYDCCIATVQVLSVTVVHYTFIIHCLKYSFHSFL